MSRLPKGGNTLFATSEEAINNTIGRILTLIDTVGLPEKQEKALKDQLKRLIWELNKVVLPQQLAEKVDEIQITFYPSEELKSLKQLGQDER